ncbi:type II toxin-antitoxin system death-on-curing family toxin [Mucilaginibacter gynuensis]|uniref:Type II toxin-antitoxin system death-on-curing family toxin n=1 Tax=Mucilaginibacter gynuensis TaxID=1302236 RepID=A0ABP8HK88_9SPHI
MITLEKVETIHNILIDKFGGSKGIRDEGGLKAALARPYATFDQQDLYPTPIDKAAAIFESLIINHPFVDGNKRIAYFMLRATLLSYHLDIGATQEEKYHMVIEASKGALRFDEIKAWISQNIIK